jgi:hypothetical protein
MVNIKYGSNYHIKCENDKILITFTDGNTLYSQTIENGKSLDKEVVDFCEEIVPLSDGKTLKRVRDNLTIVE